MKEDIQQTHVIPPEFHNQRLDSTLARLMPQYSRAQISQWIKQGAVRVNSLCLKPKDKVCAHDVVELRVTHQAVVSDFSLCLPEAIPLDVIYEDEDVLLINKPSGLVVHPGAGNKEHTLVNALLHYAPSLKHLPRAGILHRLDKDTTGLLIVAKNLESFTYLGRHMQERAIGRTYKALVVGQVLRGDIIDTYYGRHPKNRLKMAVLKSGRQAITHYSVEQEFYDFTLLQVRLMTGRTHQIRVHMHHIGHPIVGDALYNNKMCQVTENPLLSIKLQSLKRQALHAASLRFTHPKSQKELTFHAPLPTDFQALLDALREHYNGN